MAVLTSPAFVAMGAPFATMLVEWGILVNSKANDDGFLSLNDLGNAASLLATALVSGPIILAARTVARRVAQSGHTPTDIAVDDVVSVAVGMVMVFAHTRVRTARLDVTTRRLRLDPRTHAERRRKPSHPARR